MCHGNNYPLQTCVVILNHDIYSFAVILRKEDVYFINVPAVQTVTSCSFDCF